MAGRHTKQTCTKCNVSKPIACYGLDRGRPKRVCRDCVAAATQRARIKAGIANATSMPDWDYARMLSKQIKLESAHVLTNAITPEDLRCLYTLQQGRCALSDRTMTIPLAASRNTTISAWRDKLPVEKRGTTVDAVRVRHDVGWKPGNVMLTCHVYALMYSMCTTYAEFKDMCAWPTYHKLEIPHAIQLARVKAERMEDRLESFNKGEPIIW